MFGFFSVENIAFTILDYPMSYVELIGTLLYLASVWLIARRNMLTWPVGIVSVLLYMVLFYQIRLYADTVEQVYYLLASVYGWWFWRTQSAVSAGAEVPLVVFYSARPVVLLSLGIIAAGTLAATAFFSQAHVLLPDIFPAPAAYPFLDALTTVMSFVAMALMARKRTESWIYWIIVDVIGIGLYYAQNVRFIALLYVILLLLALNGLRTWHRAAVARPAIA
ncbi:MAG: nicotinamide riboside transporter PnuC [Anaerolineae bacterium]|jgi:nicotinamide mononucleotide transporter|nr:nicotinamide riboside transporter PnuC [Anaerolineae bacterium]